MAAFADTRLSASANTDILRGAKGVGTIEPARHAIYISTTIVIDEATVITTSIVAADEGKASELNRYVAGLGAECEHICFFNSDGVQPNLDLKRRAKCDALVKPTR